MIRLLLFQLIIAHIFADFVFQSNVMAESKNRHNKPEYIPKGQKFTPCWHYWLSAHAIVHGGMCYLVTGLMWICIAEFVLHFTIDLIKCESLIGPHTDQVLHYLCKFGYVIIIGGIIY